MNHKKKILVVCPNNWDRKNLNHPGIQKVPTTEEVKKLKNRFSEAMLYTFARKGDRLSDYLQDEESYLFAILNLGGQSWEDVYAYYEQTKTMLSFEFSDT